MASTRSISVSPFPPARRSRWPRCHWGPAWRSTSSSRLEARHHFAETRGLNQNLTKRRIEMKITAILIAIGALVSRANASDNASKSTAATMADERAYTEGPVTLVTCLAVEYGHFEEYIDWLNSTWKPTMEATNKPGIIIDYMVF